MSIPSNNMVYCSKCGFKAGKDDEFCARCGARLREVNDVDWKGLGSKEKDSFWNNLKDGFRHVFFDTEEKLSKNRKIINWILLVAVVAMAAWLLAPHLNTEITIGGDSPIGPDGNCKYRLTTQDVEVTNTKFYSSNNTMSMLITNSKSKDVVLETLVKTYEFKFDGSGESEEESVSTVIPAGNTLQLSFSVKEEPYIVGLELSNCEKVKVSDWKNNS